MAYWKAEERRLAGDRKLPGHRRVAITPLDMFRGGALWEVATYFLMIRQSFRVTV